MNYFVRQCVYIILLLIVGNSNGFNPKEIKTDLINSANKDEIISIGTETKIKLDKDGYLGESNYTVVWKGVLLTNKNMPVAVKFGIKCMNFVVESFIITELNSYFTENPKEKRFPTAHHFGTVLSDKYAAIVMTLYDKSVEHVIKNDKQLLSPANLLRVFYHAVAALEHIQAHDVIHQDIEPNNLMFNIGRDKVVLIDYDMAVIENNRNIKGNNRMYCSVTRHLEKLESVMDDMKSLFYVMLHYAGVDLPWQDDFQNKTDLELAEAKNQYDNIFLLCKKTGPPAVQKVFEQYYKDVMLKVANISSIETDPRRPKTDKMKKYILDGIEALVSNRNPDFYWGKDEKNQRRSKTGKKKKCIFDGIKAHVSNRKISSSHNKNTTANQQGNQTVPEPIPILPFQGPSIRNAQIPIVNTIDTCTFDVLFHTYATIYKDNKELSAIMNRSNKSFDNFLVSSLSTKKMYKTIENRGKLLCDMFPNRVNNETNIPNVTDINLNMFIQDMMVALFLNSDITYSTKRYAVCTKCNSIFNTPHLFVPLKRERNWTNIVDNLQDCIDKIDFNYECEKCKNTMTLNIKYNPVVFIDVIGQYPDPINIQQKFPINKDRITKKIILDGKLYNLHGAIQQAGTVDEGHVIAHARRNNGQWEKYDDNFPASIMETPSAFASLFYIYAISDKKP